MRRFPYDLCLRRVIFLQWLLQYSCLSLPEVDVFNPVVGDYDKLAIAYGYRPVEQATARSPTEEVGRLKELVGPLLELQVHGVPVPKFRSSKLVASALACWVLLVVIQELPTRFFHDYDDDRAFILLRSVL